MSEKDRDDAAVLLTHEGLRWLRTTPTATVHAFRIWIVQYAQKPKRDNDWVAVRVTAARRCADQIYAMWCNLRPDSLPVDTT